MTDDDWTRTLTVDFLAAVRTTRAALPHLLERGSASIVTVSPVNAHLPDPLVIDYSAAKVALANFCKSLSKEAGPRGVRVTRSARGRSRRHCGSARTASAPTGRGGVRSPRLGPPTVKPTFRADRRTVRNRGRSRPVARSNSVDTRGGFSVMA
ncbi:SDR family NAD(P)-dependent oxidoreductase [Kitasatospora sp. NPDC052868]|uniref:SDR family NAD(P)-dependent oxidoreductase n=1 Tax=Kitasatospora sp. NPDC052868 TaxID=3364060 RepID=UPI0037CA85FC